MIADFRVFHFLSRGDLKPVDDSPMNLRCRQKRQLFGGDAFDVTTENQVAILCGNRDWKTVKLNSSIPFESGANLLYDCFVVHRVFESRDW